LCEQREKKREEINKKHDIRNTEKKAEKAGKPGKTGRFTAEKCPTVAAVQVISKPG
jgi:hypothetical protein